MFYKLKFQVIFVPIIGENNNNQLEELSIRYSHFIYTLRYVGKNEY